MRSTARSTTMTITRTITRTTTRTIAAAVAVGVAVTLVLVVGPTALAEHAAAGVRALTERYGTAWVALAGIVALAVVLVRRAQPRRSAPVPAPVAAERRPHLTLVRAEGQS